jgi:hypothetical protein
MWVHLGILGIYLDSHPTAPWPKNMFCNFNGERSRSLFSRQMYEEVEKKGKKKKKKRI